MRYFTKKAALLGGTHSRINQFRKISQNLIWGKIRVQPQLLAIVFNEQIAQKNKIEFFGEKNMIFPRYRPLS